jgi:hypothetical protein
MRRIPVGSRGLRSERGTQGSLFIGESRSAGRCYRVRISEYNDLARTFLVVVIFASRHRLKSE